MRPLACASLLWVVAGCGAEPRFEDRDIDAQALGKRLPAGFLLGTATAAHQVEGGNANDWTDWEGQSFADGQPHIADGTRSGEASQSYQRFAEDLSLMQRLGANAYRFSVEWSRIEPARGQLDETVLQHYLDWATQLRAQGITPMVTLYHFTLPRWVAAQGGWESDQTLQDFERFVGVVATRLGGQVDLWCTLNEPNVYVVQGYLNGVWPPGKSDGKLMGQVFDRLLEAHARAAAKLRESDTVDADGDGVATRIGLAHHVRVLQAASHSTADNFIAGASDAFINESVVQALRTGRVRISVPGSVEIDREVPGLKGSADWLGVNYYTRDHVRMDLSEPSLSNQYVPRGHETTDLGWEVYPQGLYRFLKRLAHEGLPLYITENGLADESGEARAAFLRRHLAAVEQAAREGVDVRGYFHWSLLDNFEWADGFQPRFGLFRVDYASPTRTRSATPAVETFRTVARNLGLNPVP